MKKLLEIVKGFLIGVANIIPGVSGGTIMVLVGVYDTLLYNISNFFKSPWKAIKSLGFILIGLFAGILGGYLLIGKLLLPLFPLEMAALFSGLILGGLKNIYKEFKGESPKWYQILIYTLTFALIIVMAIIKVTKEDTSTAVLDLNLANCIIMAALGAVSAAAMIVPGVSGSIVLLAFGYYQTILNTIGGVVEELITFKIGPNFLLLVCFAVGVIFSLVFTSKLLHYLLEKHKRSLYYGIAGLVSSSVIAVIILGSNGITFTSVGNGILHVSICVVLFALGTYLGYLMAKLGKEDNMIDFKEEAKKVVDAATTDLCELLKCASVLDEYDETSSAPFGEGNVDALNTMLKIAERDGFKVENDDNYAGSISFGSGDDYLGILGHLDVVPAVGTWTYGPFNPTVADGKLYARGTLDDKGPVIASYYAMKILKDAGFKPNKEIRIIVGCDEESGSRCMDHYFKTHNKPGFGFSPDADFPLIFGEKGILGFAITGTVDNDEVVAINSGLRPNIVPDLATLEVKEAKNEYLDEFKKTHNVEAEVVGNTYQFHGVASHAMIPHLGVNAAVIMFEFMNEYYPCEVASYITNYFDTTGEKQGIAISDPLMKDLTINLGMAQYDGKDLTLVYNLRVPLDEHVEVIKAGFNKALDAYKTLTLGEFGYSPRHFVDPTSPEIIACMNAYQEMSGDYESKPITIGGGTYARIIPTAVAFGPTFPYREDICHQPDEFIYLEDFEKWIAIYAKAIYELTK